MKTQTTLLAIISVLCSMMLSSCVSMSSMQTARTLGQGNTETAIGVSRVSYEFVSDLDTLNEKTVTGEIDWRYGVTDKLDVGVKASIIGTSGGYAKYQFLGDSESKFAGSGGIGLGFLTLSSGSGEFETKSKTTDVSVPLYFSYHPTDWVGIYTSPRYTLRNIRNSDADGSEGSTSHWYGATTGVKLGKKVAPFLEYSIFTSSDATKPLSQVTGGISIAF